VQLIRIGKWAALGPPEYSLIPPGGGVIGRAKDCDLSLNDPAVSLRHAQVGISSQGVFIQDLGSRHGILVDGKPVPKANLSMSSSVGIVSFKLKCAPLDLHLANEDELEELLTRLYMQDRQSDGMLLSKAWADISPKSGGALRMLAWFLLRDGKLGWAARVVERALWRSPGHPAARLAGALLAERQGRLGEAGQTLQELAKMQPPYELAILALSRVRKKEKVYAKLGGLISRRHGAAPSAPINQAKLKVGPFTFSYTAGLHDQLVQVAYAALAQAAEQINRRMDFNPGPVEVVIKDQLESGRIEAAALFNDAIELHADLLAQGDPNFLYVALAHEYVHLMLNRMCGGACPRWLDEGVAQYLTQNPSPKDRMALDRARQKDALLPLEALDCDFAALEHPDLVDLAYAQAYSVVEFLMERCEGADIAKMLKPFRKNGSDPYGGSVCGVPLAELEEKWIKWLR
jgi:tetratricopeptide (TPR) repeat protein